MYLWRQWRTGRNRFQDLRSPGISTFQAAVAAGCCPSRHDCSIPAVSTAQNPGASRAPSLEAAIIAAYFAFTRVR